MEYVLKTSALTKIYGKQEALKDLTMNIPKGAIYGFVGKNGAGKTTLIRVICGLQEPSGGGYSLYGVPHTDKRGICRVRRRMGAVVETPAIYLSMTAEDNLKQQAMVLGLPSYDNIPELLSAVGLGDAGKKKARNFSLGMKQRLGIALALVGNPDLLVLDEPINGLDPQGIIEIRELVLRLNRERGITFLISSHILDELSKIATNYGFIDKGRIVKEISARELNAVCRKCAYVRVSDTRALARVLDSMGHDYDILSGSEANIFAHPKISELSAALAGEGCELISIEERDESLESFYINLLGGEKNE